MCVEEGWNFVDVAGVMRDEKGNLPDAYCSDAPTMGMHFTNEACQVWVDYLLTHTGYVPQAEVEAETEVEAEAEDVIADGTVETDAEVISESFETVQSGTEE
jgi:hypothetical protein